MDQEQITTAVGWLVDDWCEVRKLKVLRYALAAFPPESKSAADWVRLEDALRKVLATCADELSDAEKDKLSGLVAALQPLTSR